MAAELLLSDSIVAEQFDQAERDLTWLKDARGAIAHLTTITNFDSGENTPIDSYDAQLACYTGKLVAAELIDLDTRRVRTVDEAIDVLLEKEDEPGGFLIYAPFKDDPDGRKLGEVLAHLRPEADLDGMTAAGRKHHFPATPQSVDSLVHLGTNGYQFNAGEFVTFGDGRTVMDPYKLWLRKTRGIRPGIEINNRKAAENFMPYLHRIGRVIVTATGSAGGIRLVDLLGEGSESDDEEMRTITVVDAGVNVFTPEEGDEARRDEEGNVYGDVHPEVYDYDGKHVIRITPGPVVIGGMRQRKRLGAGVGPGTVSRMVGNGITAAYRAVDLSERSRAA